MRPVDVTVRVPATSANLGSGFDALGLALDLPLELRVRQGEEQARPGAMERMVVSAARAAFRRAGVSPPPLSATVLRPIPIGKGLGASAAARAAGIVAANSMAGRPLDASALLGLGCELEGHADNIVPAMLGGMRVAIHEDGCVTQCEVAVPADLRIVLFVPAFGMPTQESRRRLPQRLSRADAVFNVGRAALLVAAMAAGRLDLLTKATEDRLHQPARAEIFPAMRDLMQAAVDAGAHGAYLSGGGSTIAAFATTGAEGIERAMAQAAARAGVEGETMITSPSQDGALILNEA